MRLFSAHLRSIVVLIALSAALGCTNNEQGRSSPQGGADGDSKNQPIRLLDLDGKSFDLWKQEPARTTVVVFTRSDCPISNRFAPAIRKLHETYHPREVDFYLIYLDPRERPEEIRHHLEEYKYPCPGLRDPEHTLVARCQVTTTPEAVVFDKQQAITYAGRINDLYVELGKSRPEPTTHDLADAIESTIVGQPVVTPRTKAIGCPIAGLAD